MRYPLPLSDRAGADRIRLWTSRGTGKMPVVQEDALAEKSEPHPTDDTQQPPKVKTLAEALDETGFVPLNPPRQITLRRFGPARRLTRWRKPEGQE